MPDETGGTGIVLVSSVQQTTDLWAMSILNDKIFHQGKTYSIEEQIYACDAKQNLVTKIPQENLFPAFNVLVHPQLEFYVQAWAADQVGDMRKLEIVQRGATRLLLDLRELLYKKSLQWLMLLFS